MIKVYKLENTKYNYKEEKSKKGNRVSILKKKRKKLLEDSMHCIKPIN